MAAPFVQTGNSGTPSGTATSKAVTLGTAQTAGNLNIVTVCFGAAAPSFVVPSISVTDTKGNTYSPIGTMIQHGASASSAGTIIYYASNIAAGSNTVTVTLGSAKSFFIIGVFEYSRVSGATTVDVSVSNKADQIASTSFTSTNLSLTNPNDLLFGLAECFDGPQSIDAPFTQQMKQYVCIAGDQTVSSLGPFSFTGTSTGTSGWTVWLVAFQGPVSAPAPPSNTAAEILLSQRMTASEGTPANLQDANAWTWWSNASAGAWAQIDAATPVTLTRVRMSPVAGGEDMIIGGTIKASNDGTFATGVNTLLTISNRLVTGSLLNEYLLSPGAAYRYYRYYPPSAGNNLADLDFIATNSSGVWGLPATPVLSPTQGQYDLPTYFTLSSITSDATIHYTTDGSTPSSSSPAYTGPIVIGSSCMLSAVAISPAGGTSHQVSYPIHIGATEVSTDNIYDNRGYRLWALNGNIFFDPASRYWYRYGVGFDTPSAYAYGNTGNWIYRSADLRNWEYRGTAMAPAAGQANTVSNNVYDIAMHVLYNAANHNYVAWTENYTAVSISNFTWNGKKVWIAPSAEGPFTLFATYTAALAGQVPAGDFCLFLDTDGATAYLVSTGGSNDYIIVSPLNSAFTNFSGTPVSYSYISIYGSGKYEAPYMIWNGSAYILAQSPEETFVAGLGATVYATASSPMGPFTQHPGNPFQPTPGNNPDPATSYDSQIWQILYIPGRNAYIYHGDRYDVQNNNFGFSKRIRLPVTWSGNTMSISWNPAWSFDGVSHTVSGAPAAPTSVVISGQNISWTNVEPYPCKLYVDVSSAGNLVGSFAVSDRATSFSIPAVGFSPGYSFRVRNVNASGSSLSSIATLPLQGSAGINPPFLPMSFPPGPPTVPVWEDGPKKFVIYNGQGQTSQINTANPLPSQNFSPSAGPPFISQIK